MWVVESTVVINARDNTKSALSSVQSGLEKLAHEAINVKSEFSQISLSWLTWFERQRAKLQNEVNRLSQYLWECTKWTQEYEIVSARLEARQQALADLFQRSADEQAKANEEYVNSINKTNELTEAENRLQTTIWNSSTAINSQNQALQWNETQVLSLKDSIKIYEAEIEKIKWEQQLLLWEIAWLIQEYGRFSPQVREAEERLKDLDTELKNTKKLLKDANSNTSLLWQAFSKLWRNIKSLFLLQTAKRLIDTTRKAINAAIDEFLEWGLKMEAVAEQFDYLAQRGGMDAIQLRNSLREASRGMVADTDLMKSANTAMMLWVGQNMEMMTNLMKIAQVRGAEMSETTTKAFDDIVRWIWRLSPMILDNLWIIINLKDVYSEYASKIGKSSDELTKAEKQMAVYNEILKKSQSELNARWRDNLSVADKINQLKIKAINALDTVWGAFFRWIEPMIDWLNRIMDKSVEVADDVSSSMDSATNNIRVSISEMVENVRDSVSDWVSRIRDTLTDIAHSIDEWVSKLAKWFIEFFWWTVEDWQSASLSLTQYFVVWLQTIWKMVEAVWIAFQQLWKIAKGWLNTWWKVLSGIIDDLKNWDWKKKVGAWLKVLNPMSLVSEYTSQAVTDIKNNFNEVSDTFKQFWDDWSGWYNDLLQDNEDLMNSFGKPWKSSKAGDWRDALFGWDDNSSWGWGSKNSKKWETWLDKQKKLMDEYAKETKKRHNTNKDLFTELDNISKRYLKDLENEIKATEKEFEKAMDDVQDKIDDTTKEIEKLEKEIDKLNEELANLWKEENTSLAKEIIKEQDWLKKLEKQFEWITDIAKNTSRDEINNAMDWDFIGWYAVENIKKAKQYAEWLSGVYDWMSDEQIEALKEEIKYQEWYNSLNPIEQIKEDYRVKREEINKELEEKLKALDKENELKQKYEQELLDVQAKYTPIIEEQKRKYQEVTDLRLDFEEKYHNRITINWDTELAYTQQLEIWWNKVATARKNALSTGGWWGWDNYDWPKADWWTVLAWKQYLVWERWPELFVPRSNWSIVPNENITNNNGVSINLSWITVRSDADINAITDEIIRKIKLEKTFWIA